ncbi:MAG: DUF2141 domain-containing protein [Azonexus sp.]|nr:DUF2141 domain-containing protein [Azonexus sp.]
MRIITKLKTVLSKLIGRQVPRMPNFGLLLCCLLASGQLQAAESRLVITLQGISNDVGNIRASLYQDQETFRKENKALKTLSIPAAKGDTKLVFNGLPPGRYAIMAYHDENSDEKLNLRFGMFPVEGYGLSNNTKVMGPPKFVDSAFDVVEPETTIDIRLTY